MTDFAIKISNLSKKYKIGQHKHSSLRETLMNFSKEKDSRYFWALRDINLDIKKGDAIGIIGKNGAGKSTLLKILSKITYPTSGRVELNGRVSSLLEVGTGFHPELSGRENVFLNGTILGMRRNEIKAKFDEIVDFSGVNNFIDTPIKHYSSGMKVRLAFAVAAFLEPEILIIDEVLAVGDAEFQKKCLGKMEDVTGEGRTVLFVSHNMAAIDKLCKKAVVLNSGKVVFSSDTKSSIKQYLKLNQSKSNIKLEQRKDRKGTGELTFTDVKILSLYKTEINHIELGSDLQIELYYKINNPNVNLEGAHFSVNILDKNDMTIIHHSNLLVGKTFTSTNILNTNKVTFSLSCVTLTPGDYYLSIDCVNKTTYIDCISNVAKFSVIEKALFNYVSKPHAGIVVVEGDWRI